jgi:hypothetical protein
MFGIKSAIVWGELKRDERHIPNALHFKAK